MTINIRDIPTLIFDLDDTLADSSPGFSCNNSAFNRLGDPDAMNEETWQTIGLSLSETHSYPAVGIFWRISEIQD